MALKVPKLDDRSYQEILNEALARIRVHNPEWRNAYESDPGVTILELFAFMSESLLYRSNQIPERNRRKFLTLLGIPMQPATAARGFVTFQNERGPLATVTLSPDIEVLAGQVPFRTQGGLDVLPVEGRFYYKRKLAEDRVAEVRDLYTKLHAEPGEADDLVFYETALLEDPADPAHIPELNLLDDTVDGSLWLALLARTREDPADARRAIGGKVLNLGLLPAYTETGKVLRPLRAPAGSPPAPLVFEIATSEIDPGTESPRYRRLDASVTADILTEPGLAAIKLPEAAEMALFSVTEPLTAGTGDYPPSLEDSRDEGRIVTWIRIRLSGATSGSGLSARISWAGCNAAMVAQRAHVAAELLGRGTGEPDQTFTLVNRPVIRGSVRLTVGGAEWEEIDDLLAAPPEVPVRDRRAPPGTPQRTPASPRRYTVDRESGEIRCGTGANGERPAPGADVRASYDYGGGTQGNVAIGAISKSPSLPSGLKVHNPLPTWGGDEPESVAEAERNIPRYLKHRDRAVTAADFKEIVQRTPGVDVGRAEVLPLFHPSQPDLFLPGVVTLMVIPRYDVLRPEAPLPNRPFLDLVCAHVDARRLITTEVYVVGPDYRKIYVSAGIEVEPGRDFPPVREAVNQALRRYLSPLTGGREEQGWPLAKPVLARELWAEANRVDGVSYVKDLLLGDDTGARFEEIPMTGRQLPWLVKVDTQSGDPASLDTLRGTATVSAAAAAELRKRRPVPVIPSKC